METSWLNYVLYAARISAPRRSRWAVSLASWNDAACNFGEWLVSNVCPWACCWPYDGLQERSRVGEEDVPAQGLGAVELRVSGDSWREWVSSQVVPVHLSAPKRLSFVVILSISKRDFSDTRPFKESAITLGWGRWVSSEVIIEPFDS